MRDFHQSIEITCPGCKKVLAVSLDLEGKTIVCPSDGCGERIKIPRIAKKIGSEQLRNISVLLFLFGIISLAVFLFYYNRLSFVKHVQPPPKPDHISKDIPMGFAGREFRLDFESDTKAIRGMWNLNRKAVNSEPRIDIIYEDSEGKRKSIPVSQITVEGESLLDLRNLSELEYEPREAEMSIKGSLLFKMPEINETRIGRIIFSSPMTYYETPGEGRKLELSLGPEEKIVKAEMDVYIINESGREEIEYYKERLYKYRQRVAEHSMKLERIKRYSVIPIVFLFLSLLFREKSRQAD